jgi:hypothetical protein
MGREAGTLLMRSRELAQSAGFGFFAQAGAGFFRVSRLVMRVMSDQSPGRASCTAAGWTMWRPTWGESSAQGVGAGTLSL